MKDDSRNVDIVSEYIDFETREIKRGRGDSLNLDDEKRKEIATLALTSGLTIDEVSRLTGSSPDAVNAYKHGARSEATYNEKDNPVGDHVREIKGEVTERATNKLMLAIEALTGEKVNASKARDIAGIAKDMSAVIKNMSNESGMNISNSKVIVYQPRIKEEDDYVSISVDD